MMNPAKQCSLQQFAHGATGVLERQKEPVNREEDRVADRYTDHALDRHPQEGDQNTGLLQSLAAQDFLAF